MCLLLKVSRSSFYNWVKIGLSQRAKENQMIAKKIHVIFKNSHNSYGTRRIKRALINTGLAVSRRRIGHLMKSMALACKTKRRFRITTDSKHQLPVAENLLNRNFNVANPNQYYVGDITYISTQSGWLYLAVVIDLFSRKIVGWAMNKNMTTSLVNDALLMAISSRKPQKGLVWHTDRGSQYASDSHRKLLSKHAITQSMSRKGNCWDNAVAESFFHTLKTELTHHLIFKTREEAKKEIFKYIEIFYNRVRMHSSNNYLSPMEYELAHNF
jgi:transposase InsO family protein